MATIATRMEDVRSFSIGRVFARAFATIKHNAMVTLAMAVVLGALPMFAFSLVLPNANRFGPSALTSNAQIGIASLAILGWVGMLVLTVLVQAALTRATVAESEGRRASFGECLGAGIKVILPLVGLIILWWIGVTIGFVLLVIPGIILITMWSVAIPALVEERQGVFAAFRRSAMLTKGERWKVFGLLMVLLVAFWLIMIALSLVGVASTIRTGVPPAGGFSIGMMLASVIPSTLFNLAWGTVQPALYVELRGVQFGGDVDALHEVFA